MSISWRIRNKKSAATDVKISILGAICMVCVAYRSIVEYIMKNSFKQTEDNFHAEYKCSDQIIENEEDLNVDLNDDEWQSISDGLVFLVKLLV